jgi:hypothetical protein
MNYTFGPAAGTLIFNDYKLVFDWTYNSLYFYTGKPNRLTTDIKDTEGKPNRLTTDIKDTEGKPNRLTTDIKDTEGNEWITIELGKCNMLEIVNKEYCEIFMQMCKKIYNESIIHPYESVRRNRILLNDLIDYKIV